MEHDIFLFLGQSNMAGRGAFLSDDEQFPKLLPGAGYEYRAVSDPARLHDISEPFGIDENRKDGIYDVWPSGPAKSGSLVTSFVNSYYCGTCTPVIGLSASKGGSKIEEWLPGTPYHDDLISRIDSMNSFLEGKEIRGRYVLFCQGESDGDVGTDKKLYKKRVRILFDSLRLKGFSRFFMILIGKKNVPGHYDDYDEIRSVQKEMGREWADTFVVASFEDMLSRNLMKDEFHYYQSAYNEVGQQAGFGAAEINIE